VTKKSVARPPDNGFFFAIKIKASTPKSNFLWFLISTGQPAVLTSMILAIQLKFLFPRLGKREISNSPPLKWDLVGFL